MLFDCVFNVWSPTIGDPTIMGWVTVAAYFATALLAYLVSVRVTHIAWERKPGRNRLFWLLLMLMLLFLGVNKQLDLQSYFTAIAKCSAQLDGWYADRREYQLLFIEAIGGLSILAALFLLWFFRAHMAHNGWAIIGVTILLSFIVIRAASFHHFDILINYRFYGIRMNWVLELSGILLIALQSVINLRKEKMVVIDFSKG